jgi:hypothetical protein
MYNKEISEKMLDDAFYMMDNIRESKNICEDIINRNKKKMDSIDYGSAMYVLNIIEQLDNETQKDVSEMIDINGEVEGYDTETYLLLINLYGCIVRNNKEMIELRNKIRERYM